MVKGYNIKNLESTTYAFQRRVMHIIVLVVALAVILFMRLFYLQVIERNYYQTMSSNNSISLLALAPQRGLIYDRSGKILAKNMPVYSLEIIPDQVQNLPDTVARLHAFIKLSPEDLRLFYRQVTQKRPFVEVPLKIKLSDDEVAKFYVNQFQFPGVKIAARLIRYYPYKEDMVDFLGYTGRINLDELANLDTSNYSATNYIGKLGLELYFEPQLHGTVGYQQVETDASGRAVRSLNTKAAVPGENLYLTIDADLQEVATKAMAGYSGSVVVIDPRNGQILTMVSAPGYDPNKFVRGISNEDYQALRNSPNQPLFNRAIRGLYPPGSTVKPIYALQGLKTNNITPEFRLFDPGYYQLKGVAHKYRDWKIHGWVNLVKAIAESCNTYFYHLADKMGIANLATVLNEFGLGKRTGIEIREELPGLVPTPEWRMRTRGQRWYSGDTLIVGIGQGSLLATPLQLAVMTTIIANRGIHYQPTLIEKTVNSNGEVNQRLPILEPQVNFSPDTWNDVIAGMVAVIRAPGGTGYRFGRPKYSVAAKTGTAQLFDVGQNQKYSDMKVAEKLKDNSMFIAFAPVDHPKIAIAVAMQNNPEASAVARKIIDYYLITQKHLNDKDPDQTVDKTTAKQPMGDNKNGH